MTDLRLQIRVVPAIAEIPAAAWDACAGATPHNPSVKPEDEDKSSLLSTQGYLPNPFILHDFLLCLEQSKSVGGRTGWQPHHLIAETGDGAVLGVAPCYLKSHSRGQYVFDHGWAEAYENAGGRYYPKLQVAVPFTPVTGPRLLARPGDAADAVRGALADGLADHTRRHGLSSAHISFLTEAEWRMLGGKGFLQRTDQQFHWDNPGYATFEDFLDALASAKAQGSPRAPRGAARPASRSTD